MYIELILSYTCLFTRTPKQVKIGGVLHHLIGEPPVANSGDYNTGWLRRHDTTGVNL